MIKETKAFCCMSGGKDSILSFYRAWRAGTDISYLLNMISSDGSRSRSHGIDSGCLRLQAVAMGVPIIQRRTSWENYENEFKKIVSDLRDKGINTGIFGDIDIQEHRDWVERVCGELRVKAVLPLWGLKREEILTEFIDLGFKAVICAVKADLLTEELLGIEINSEFIKQFESMDDIDICGENGEYHTFVYNGPVFKKGLDIKKGRKILKDNHWFLEIIVK